MESAKAGGNKIKKLSLGYSPCPNDTFIFYALVHGRIKGAPLFEERLEDVEALNRMALEGELDVTKLSAYAYGHLRDKYVALRSGGAMGRGAGPLVVAGKSFDKVVDKARLGGGKIKVAIPGGLTTACLLLLLYEPSLRGKNLQPMVFSEVMRAVKEGRADAGVVIHEGRFTYREHGLKKIVDLGKWWEDETGLPVPLGAIAARRSLGRRRLLQVEEAIRQSVLYAVENPSIPIPYVRRHAQEMGGRVIEKHIKLYVNDYTVWMGREGEEAMRELLKRAAMAGFFSDGSYRGGRGAEKSLFI